MSFKSVLLAVAAIVPFAVAPALAAASDQSFADTAARGGLAEVQAGNLAQQKGATSAVKQFGATLVQDHTASNQQLEQIARQQNITLPTTPSATERSEAQKLQGLSGAAFDRQFVANEVQDHKKDIAMFQQEAQTGKDSALRSYAEKSIPVLQKHLQMAESLENGQR